MFGSGWPRTHSTQVGERVARLPMQRSRSGTDARRGSRGTGRAQGVAGTGTPAPIERGSRTSSRRCRTTTLSTRHRRTGQRPDPRGGRDLRRHGTFDAGFGGVFNATGDGRSTALSPPLCSLAEPVKELPMRTKFAALPLLCLALVTGCASQSGYSPPPMQDPTRNAGFERPPVVTHPGGECSA